ncbi:MAG: IS1096 element passenger TnpR family protein [Propionibacteriaceae bacterium]
MMTPGLSLNLANSRSSILAAGFGDKSWQSPVPATTRSPGPAHHSAGLHFAVVSGAACRPRGRARTWLSVTVELLGSRGEELWPWPGRIVAVGPSHTFFALADAINGAFGRWDRSHLSMFILADGQVVTDESTGAEMADAAGGLISAPLDIEVAKVARVLKPGAEFQFAFDLGDAWTHRCEVAEDRPRRCAGHAPRHPVAVLGVVGNSPGPVRTPVGLQRRGESTTAETEPAAPDAGPRLARSRAAADAGSGRFARIDRGQRCCWISGPGDGMRRRRCSATGGGGGADGAAAAAGPG